MPQRPPPAVDELRLLPSRRVPLSEQGEQELVEALCELLLACREAGGCGSGPSAASAVLSGSSREEES